jgi:hypothetical protein
MESPYSKPPSHFPCTYDTDLAFLALSCHSLSSCVVMGVEWQSSDSELWSETAWVQTAIVLLYLTQCLISSPENRIESVLAT